MKKYCVEFIGTFFLVFTVGCTVISPGAGIMTPVAIGAALMIMVFAGGHVSGAHYNPAVTLAVWIRGRIETLDVLGYWVAQLAAAFAGAWVTHFFKVEGSAQILPIGIKAAFLAEFLFTFALAWVMLNVATAKGTSSNSFYGMAIGMTVLVGAYAVGGVSGGSFNPAVTTGITLMGLASWGNYWLFLLAEFAGGAVAAGAYKLINGDE